MNLQMMTKASAWDKIFCGLCFSAVVWLIICSIFGIMPAIVQQNSMAPTYCDSDLILMHRLDEAELPNRGDVVTFFAEPGNSTLYVKRVIGLPGDQIRADDDVLTVNGRFFDNIPGTGSWIVNVPDKHIFRLGDNRASSYDCRYMGCIPVEQLCAKIL